MTREIYQSASARPKLELLPFVDPAPKPSSRNHEDQTGKVERKFNSIFDRLVVARQAHVEIRRLRSQVYGRTTTLKHLPIYRLGFSLYLEEISQLGPVTEGQLSLSRDRYIGFERNRLWSSYQLRHNEAVIRVDRPKRNPNGWGWGLRLVGQDSGNSRVSQPAEIDELNKLQSLLETDGVL